MRSERGFSLVELIVTIAILGFLILILVSLERELVLFDRKTRVDLFTQPNTSAVLHRIRRDVLDAKNYVDEAYGEYEPGPSVLLLDFPPSWRKAEESYVIVWDFSEEKKAKRIELVDGEKISEWATETGAKYEIAAWQACTEESGCGGPYYMRLLGHDAKGAIVVDQKVAPAVLRD